MDGKEPGRTRSRPQRPKGASDGSPGRQPGRQPGKTKSNSSRWINEERLTPRKFRWQTEYGAFSVSRSNVDAVREYIRGQKEHHRRITFREELMTLLRRHEVEFDPRFV